MRLNTENLRTHYERTTDALSVEFEGIPDRYGEMAIGATGGD